MCPKCRGQAFQWELSSGRGVVYSFSVVHRRPRPDTPVPFVLGLIELEEGWYMLSQVVDCDPDAVGCGMPVAVRFERVSDGFTLPVFIPAGAAP